MSLFFLSFFEGTCSLNKISRHPEQSGCSANRHQLNKFKVYSYGRYSKYLSICHMYSACKKLTGYKPV